MDFAWLLVAAMIGPDQQVGPEPMRETIIVTGERIPRRIAETPSSVMVVTGDQLESLPFPADLDQLLGLVPNVQLGSGGAGPSIRGQDSTGVLRDLPAFLGGNRPRSTVQVDGRALNYYEFVFGTSPLWDVGQVEIYRSPQTTSQGRNSIGGAIFIETRDPDWHWNGQARAIIGNHQTRQFSSFLSGPVIADQLAFRLSADLFRKRPASEIGDNMRFADPDRDRYTLVRAKLLVEPERLEGLRIETAFVHLVSRSPQVEGVEAPFEARANPGAAYGIFAIRSDSLTIRIDQAFGPDLVSATTLSWGDAFIRRFAPAGRGESWIDNEDFSIESLLRWTPDGPVRLTAGLHHQGSSLDQRIDLGALPFVRAAGEFDDFQSSLGLFGQAMISPAPRLTLTAGLRYQRDRQERAGAIGPYRLDYDRVFDAWLPRLSLSYEVAPAARIGLLVQRAYNPGGATIDLLTAQKDEFDSETLWNFELFSRLSLAGGRLELESNLFLNLIRDAQRILAQTVKLPDGRNDLAFTFANVRRARSQGAEIQLTYQASPKVRLTGGIGLLSTRMTDTGEPEGLDPANRLEGKAFARSPRFSAFASLDLDPLPALRLSSQLRHHGGYFSDDFNRPALRIGSATIIDARAAWRAGDMILSFFVRNLFDRLHKTEAFSPDFGTLGDPREFGVGLELPF